MLYETRQTNNLNIKSEDNSSAPKPLWSVTYQNGCPTCGTEMDFCHEFDRFFCRNCGRMFTNLKEYIGRLDFFSEEDTVFNDKEQLKCKYYLPFRVDESDCKIAFEQWREGLKLMPMGFKEGIKLTNLRCCYVPHVLLSCNCTMILNEGAYSVKKTNRLYKTVVSMSITHEAKYDLENLPCILNRQVERDLAEAVEHYYMSSMKEFNPEEVPDDVEVLNIDLLPNVSDKHIAVRINKTSEQLSKEEYCDMADELNVRINETAPRNFEFTSVYLPIIIGEYTFEGRTYQVVINGQTGELAADLPECTEAEEKLKKRRYLYFLLITMSPLIILTISYLYNIIRQFFDKNYSIGLSTGGFTLLYILIAIFYCTIPMLTLRIIFNRLISECPEGSHRPGCTDARQYVVKDSYNLVRNEAMMGLISRRYIDPLVQYFASWIYKFIYWRFHHRSLPDEDFAP